MGNSSHGSPKGRLRSGFGEHFRYIRIYKSFIYLYLLQIINDFSCSFIVLDTSLLLVVILLKTIYMLYFLFGNRKN